MKLNIIHKNSPKALNVNRRRKYKTLVWTKKKDGREEHYVSGDGFSHGWVVSPTIVEEMWTITHKGDRFMMITGFHSIEDAQDACEFLNAKIEELEEKFK